MSESSEISQSQLVCHCRVNAPVVTSWKDENVGRRFYGCANYPNDGCCKFFRWIDPPLCERSRHIIRGLLRRLNEERAEIGNLRNENLRLEEILTITQIENELLQQEKMKLDLKCREMKAKSKALAAQNRVLKAKTNVGKWDFKILITMFTIFCACVLTKAGWSLIENAKHSNIKMLY